MVASGPAGSRPAARRAAATRAAVRRAVPDGASILFGWCSSMISTASKCRRGQGGQPHHEAPRRCRSWGRSRPPWESGARSQVPDLGEPLRRRSRSCRPRPRARRSMHHSQVGHDRSRGRVKSTTTWAARSGSRSSPAGVERGDQVQVGRASTARTTSLPIRPRAPSTATALTGDSGHATILVRSKPLRRGPGPTSASDGRAPSTSAATADVVQAHRVDPAQQLGPTVGISP